MDEQVTMCIHPRQANSKEWIGRLALVKIVCKGVTVKVGETGENAILCNDVLSVKPSTRCRCQTANHAADLESAVLTFAQFCGSERFGS